MTKLDIITFKATCSLVIIAPFMAAAGPIGRYFGADPAIFGAAVGVVSVAAMIALSWTSDRGCKIFMGRI